MIFSDYSESQSSKFKFILPVIILLTATNLASCGGGGEGSDDKGRSFSQTEEYFSQSTEELIRSVKIEGELSEITIDNSPKLLSTLFEFISFGEQFYYDFASESRWDPQLFNFVSGTESCDLGGSTTTSYSSFERRVTTIFNQCSDNAGLGSDNVSISGAERISWIEETSIIRIIQEFDSLSVVSGEQTSRIQGASEIVISKSESDVAYIELNLEIRDNVLGDIRVNDLRLDLSAETQFFNFENNLAHVSGRLEFETHGVVDITTASSTRIPYSRGRFNLTGSTPAEANLDYGYSTFLIFGYDQTGDGLNDRSTYFQMSYDYENINFANQGAPTPHLRSASFFDSYIQGRPVINQPIGFDIHRNFTDQSGNLLEYTIDLVRVEERISSLSSFGQDITGESYIEFNISQVESGYFELTAYSPVELAYYTFEINAIGEDGTYAGEPLYVEVPVYMDTDGDGDYDISDSDDDNDGESDFSDAFPKDPTETLDTDRDGLGNNADTDDDNDGYSDIDDLQPLDFLCAIASDIVDGRCIQRTLGSKGKLLDLNGILYFWSPLDSKIQRWDTNTEHFIEPLVLAPESFAGESWSYRIYYAKDQHALYITYNDSVVTRIDLNDPALEELFFLDMSSDFGDFTFIVDDSSGAIVLRQQDGAILNFFSVDTSGLLIDSYVEGRESTSEDGFFRYEDVAPFCTYGFAIDSETGNFYEIGFGSNFDCPCGSNVLGTGVQPYISPDGQRAITRFDGILDQAQNVVATPPINVAYYSVQWSSDGLYYIDSTLYDGFIHRYSMGGQLLDRMTLPNQGSFSHEILGQGDYFVIVSTDNSFVLISNYLADALLE